MNEKDIKQLWRDQSVPASTFTPDELRVKGDVFRRTVRRRNLIEYFAGAMVLTGFAFYIWLYVDLPTRIGCAVMIAGVCLVLWQLHRRASAEAPSPEGLGQPAISHYRTQLVRQRDALRWVWLWYILPLLPGYEIFIWGRRMAMGASGGEWIYALMPILGVIVVALNLYAAHKLQRQIDHLDRDSKNRSE
jgi:hypothetical protein